MEGLPAAHLDLLFGVGILLYLLSAGLHYAALAAEEAREAALAVAEARTLARDAELNALRMQINPHFLFNSLHSIAALATVDAVRAREMCIRLSDFLRSSLGLGERDSVPLREELALARSYLEVERVRFGARLQFSENIQESCQDCAVPVLLLQPLVENAVKHGIAGLVEGGAIRLSVERLGPSVRVAVENAFDPDAAPPNRLGMGLPQVRRRLELRYGGAASMQAGGGEGVYRVELRFPCEPSMASSSRA
jgi:LytS/YehU family sensor histidine kinase